MQLDSSGRQPRSIAWQLPRGEGQEVAQKLGYSDGRYQSRMHTTRAKLTGGRIDVKTKRMEG